MEHIVTEFCEIWKDEGDCVVRKTTGEYIAIVKGNEHPIPNHVAKRFLEMWENKWTLSKTSA